MAPMAETGKEATGSMGNDAPLAVLSNQAPSLFDYYFHQLFAQVTNPPIDPIRESLVMSLGTALGPDGNTFEESPEQCHQLTLPGPILDNSELARILGHCGTAAPSSPRVLSMLYAVEEPGALEAAVERLCNSAVDAVEEGTDILVLSDRGVDNTHAAIPALLALSAVNQRLVRDGIRRNVCPPPDQRVPEIADRPPPPAIAHARSASTRPRSWPSTRPAASAREKPLVTRSYPPGGAAARARHATRSRFRRP